MEKITHCQRCGRRLKRAEAQEIGYGKVCWHKHHMENAERIGRLLGGQNAKTSTRIQKQKSDI